MPAQIGKKLGRYEVRSKLGEGGMGAVYLAQDAGLDRKVALKILPPELAAKKDRMERFVREAKAAAALNHPNIAHIYEIGESEGINFIAMEFVDGDTLRHVIHGRQADLKKLLRYMQKIAEGLSKAHLNGIVHRDLKPDNIMITRDGYAKILDFGLAKLIQPQLSDPAKSGGAEQITAIMPQQSIPGVVMGTPGYMSPEQAMGNVGEIDHRSDIFSFGCILFEIATRQKPFVGDNLVKTLHKIIYEPAPLIRDLNPEAPPELQRIVRRCLAKDPDDRYQTIKDVAIELRELRSDMENWRSVDSAVPSASGAGAPLVSQPDTQHDSASSLEMQTRILSSGAPSSDRALAYQTAMSTPAMTIGNSRKRIMMLAAAAVLIAVIGLSIGLFLFLRWNRTPFTHLKVTRITASGKASNAAISPDGRYIVHVVNDAGMQSLHLRQVATNTNQEIVPPADVNYSGVAFSPDGDYIYYVMRDHANPAATLFRKPVLGGEAVKVTTNITGRATCSPDGKRFAFIRLDLQKSETSVMVANIDGSEEHSIATHKPTDPYIDVAWGPDNKTIAATTNTLKGSVHGAVVTISAAGGDEKTLSTQPWFTTERLRWVGDGSGVIVSATEQSFGANQLWFVTYPGGAARQITNDLNDYASVSVTLDDNSIVTVQREITSSIWIGPVTSSALAAPAPDSFPIERDPQRQITSGGTKHDGYFGVAWTPEGRITYVSAASGSYDLWSMAPDGSDQKQLTSALQGSIYHSNFYQAVSPDGRYTFFVSDRVTGVPHVWRMNADGTNLKQITNGAGEGFQELTPDGQSIVYVDITDRVLSKISIDGGAANKLSDKCDGRPSVSPDGKLIAFRTQSEPNAAFQIALVSMDGGPIVKTIDVPATADARQLSWTPDNRALVYIDTRAGISNLWSVRLEGGAPAKLSDFRTDRIYSFDFSRDGKSVAFSRGSTNTDVVLFNSVK
ncbi:MAG TPA: protein kinase [Pyrinomonadaceae bacterium]|nr:protein kinase [Pyrinomonadaceae bacterium]